MLSPWQEVIRSVEAGWAACHQLHYYTSQQYDQDRSNQNNASCGGRGGRGDRADQGGRGVRGGRGGRSGRGCVDAKQYRLAAPVFKRKECVVCMDRIASHAFYPCGHLCVCKDCVQNVLEPSGLKWCKSSDMNSEGTELRNMALSHALADKLEFTLHEWVAFGVKNLKHGDFVQVQEQRFRPLKHDRRCPICMHEIPTDPLKGRCDSGQDGSLVRKKMRYTTWRFTVWGDSMLHACEARDTSLQDSR